MLSGIQSSRTIWEKPDKSSNRSAIQPTSSALRRPDQFQRADNPLKAKAGHSRLASQAQKSLFERIFHTPWISRSRASKSSQRTSIIAGAQHDRKEPRNPISFEALDSMLKALDNDVDPRIGSILKNGYASGLQHLLKVGNQIVAEINKLTAQGKQNPALVIYSESPARHGSLKDPLSDRRYDYEIEPEKEVLCQVLTPRRLPTKFNAMQHWSNIARDKQGLGDLEYLEFAQSDLNHMQETVTQHTHVPENERFNLRNKEELADYAFQLFNMLYNLHLAKDEMAQQLQNNPAHYKVGIAAQNVDGAVEIHDLSHLFPGCRLNKNVNSPASKPAFELPMPLEAQRALLERLFRDDPQP